jgi:hypothetical protein
MNIWHTKLRTLLALISYKIYHFGFSVGLHFYYLVLLLFENELVFLKALWVEKLTSRSPVFLKLFSYFRYLIFLSIGYNVRHFKISVAFKPEDVILLLTGHNSNCLPLLTVKILFQSQSNPCVICGGQSDNGVSPLSTKFGVSLVLHDSVSSGSGIISLSVVTARPLSNQFNTTNTKIEFRKKKNRVISLKALDL